MQTRAFLLRVLRVPLAWKIAGANALLVLALAGGFYALPSALAESQAGLGLIFTVMFAGLILNVALISVALRPIHELERTAERVWSGAAREQSTRSLVADQRLRRVARTVDSLLEQLEADRRRLRQLSSKLIEARSTECAAIARQLTESVAQSATALALQCAGLKASNSNGNSAKLDEMSRTATGLVDEIRQLAREIHPRHMNELGLEPALRSLTRVVGLGSSFELTFTTSGIHANAAALPRAVAETLYVVARETLQNTRRHSAAKHVDVSLGVEPHLVRLTIVDDGCGFDSSSLDPTSGLGLMLISERVSLVGGTLEIDSRPGQGTRVVALVPLAPKSAAPEGDGLRLLKGQRSW